MRRFNVVAIGMSALAACATTRFAALPAPDKDQFNECFRENQSTLCPSGGKAIQRENCRERLQSDYARGDADARAQWLSDHCPRGADAMEDWVPPERPASPALVAERWSRRGEEP